MDDAFTMRQPPDATTLPAQVAAYWASAGFPVFPCKANKAPLTDHGFYDATTDSAAVAAFWRANPQAPVGPATGGASGLFVIDLDTDRDTGEAVGEASLAALGYHALVGTVPTVSTPSGGLHLYFRDCGLGNSTGKMGRKIDTRGNGGYVIAPGSVMPSGAYVLRNGPITLDRLAGVPEGLIALLKDDTAKKPPRDAMHIDTGARTGWAETALHLEIGRVMAAQEGERNDTLNSAAFSLAQIVAGGELEEASARQQLLRAGLTIGLPESEALATIASGMKAGFKSPRSPKGRSGAARTPGAGTDETAEAEGPQLLLRAIPKGAEYPVDALGPLRAAVEAVQGETLAPVAIPAQSALTVAALAVQGFADVQTLSGYSPLSLYALTVALSGERKSSCDRMLLAPLWAYEREQDQARQSEVEAWRIAIAIWKAQREAIVAETKKPGKSIGARADLEKLGPEPAAPPSADRTVRSPTYEGLTRQFRDGVPSLGIFSDEGGQFLGGYSMKSENRQSTLAALNDAWGGQAIKRTLAGEGSMTLYGRRLSVHLMVQPGVARTFMADPMAGDTGFLARFLIAEPTSTIGTRLSSKARSNPEAVAAFGERLTEVLRTALPVNPETGALEPRPLRLTSDARELLVRFNDAVEKEMGRGKSLHRVTGAASKCAEQACRIAGVLTLWKDLHAPHVDMETMKDAITLAQFYLSEAQRLSDAAMVSAEIEQAEMLRRWLLEAFEHQEVTVRDIVQFGPNALREAPKAKAALSLLASHQWLTPLEKGAVVRGSARREAWRIARVSHVV